MTKKPTKILEFVQAENWCIRPEWLQAINAVTTREGLIGLNEKGLLPEAISAKIGQPLDNTHTTTIVGSTAIIPVRGVITPRASLFSEISGLTSSESILQDFQSAMDDPQVNSIILEFDSPGGAVTGVSDVADAIFNARGKGKKIISHVVGEMASAALWMGTSADKIFASKTSIIGSIGTVAKLSKSDSDSETIEIVSTQSPNKRLDPESKEGHDAILKILNGISDVFIDAVARNRGTTVENVTNNFGQGGVFIGADALKVGLIDGLGSFDDTLAKLQGKGTTTTQDISTMDITKETIAAEHPQIAQAFREEGKLQAETAAGNEAIKADRQRVSSILAAAPKGMDAEAKEAITKGLTAGDFALSILESQKKKNSNIDAANDDDAEGLTGLGSDIGSGNQESTSTNSEKELINKTMADHLKGDS